jgi:integrase
MSRHSREDVLTDAEFAQLLEATSEIKDRFEVECRFLIVAAGRLGMRAGEIAHIDESWINWDRSIIQIPRHDPCDRGRDGDVCGYCRDRAREAVSNNEDLTYEQALAERWNPKTTNSARAIPFDFNQDVRDVVAEFFMFYDGWPASRSAINRRCDRALEAAGFSTSKAYPHSLRATAATHHSFRGVPPSALQSLFGWAEMAVAQKYIRVSGSRTQEALKKVHSD